MPEPPESSPPRSPSSRARAPVVDSSGVGAFVVIALGLFVVVAGVVVAIIFIVGEAVHEELPGNEPAATAPTEPSGSSVQADGPPPVAVSTPGPKPVDPGLTHPPDETSATGLEPPPDLGDEPTVLGSMPRELITRVMARHQTTFRFCYERELLDKPELAGRVGIDFVIDRAGSVTEAAVASNETGSDSLGACLVDTMQRLRFPSPEGGIARVTYTFLFETAGE